MRRAKKLTGNLILIIAGFLFMGYSIQPYWLDRVGTTLLNGDGCVCHTLLFPSPEIFVKVEGPDTLLAGETATYRMLLAGGVAVGGGYNVAARFGTLGIVDTFSSYLGGEVMHRFALPFPSLTDTILWEFSYTAPDTAGIDTLYSVGLTADMDDNPLTNDFWNFGENFPVVIIDASVPVELISFNASLTGEFILLTWETLTEKNNLGFEVEAGVDGINFNKMLFIPGAGTTTEKKLYNSSLPVSDLSFFRLKQIDFDGSFTYSSILNVNITPPEDFQLYRNYPNPFNPSTRIKFALHKSAYVEISVYNSAGEKVTNLENKSLAPGVHEITFNSVDYGNIASGIYYYTIDAAFLSENNRISKTGKMVLLK
jgi:hypothetical protein